jgi:hypothetical protein
MAPGRQRFAAHSPSAAGRPADGVVQPSSRATKAAGNDGTQSQLSLPSRSADLRSAVLNERLIRAEERVPAEGTGNCADNTGPV